MLAYFSRNKLAILVGGIFITQFLMLVVQVLTWQSMRDVQREVYYVGASVARSSGPEDEPSDQRRAALREDLHLLDRKHLR